MAKDKEIVGRGRPTDYREEYVLTVEYMARLGMTDKAMAEKLGVTEQTFNNWKQKYPDFFASIKRGKEEPDEKVERALFEMSTGYSYETEKALVVSDGKDAGAHVEKVTVRETIPPNPTSMIFWLKNRRPDRWRDGQTNLNLNLNKDAENLSADEEALYRAQIDAIKGVGK